METYLGADARRARRVLFDADCGICTYLCRLVQRLDRFHRLEFIANQDRQRFPASIASIAPELLDRSVVVVLPNGSWVTEGRAVFEVLRALPFGVLFAWWLLVPGLAGLGNALYRLVSRNRARISVSLGLTACAVRAKG
jgi:predicted DCC family thiol-disulfide oxidoreductase YuxK